MGKETYTVLLVVSKDGGSCLEEKSSRIRYEEQNNLRMGPEAKVFKWGEASVKACRVQERNIESKTVALR